jgi:Methylamine utilization protein MauJ
MQQHLAFMKGGSLPEGHFSVGGDAVGEYKVVLTLTRPGYNPLPEGQYTAFEMLEGDSHLAIAPPAVKFNQDIVGMVLQAQTEDGYFQLTCLANRRGFLAQVTCEKALANNFVDARMKVTRAFTSSLSNISLHIDTPLVIYQTDVVEVATGNRSMSILAPFQERAIPGIPAKAFSKEFRAYASLYREALNSNTAVFQFLCYFKIMEGIQARRRRFAMEAKAKGLAASVPVEVVPANGAEFVPWLTTIFPFLEDWDQYTLEFTFLSMARGKKFNRIIEDYLRPIRLRIAHAVLDSGEMTLSADDELDMITVYQWLPMMKCMVRHMLRVEFPSEFLV